MARIDLEGYADLRLVRDGAVLNVIFNRPEKMNPVSGRMSLELIRLLRDLVYDPETLVIVLTGAGRAFSAGGDLAVMTENLDHPERFMDAVSEVKDLVHAMIDCPKPIIAKVNGPAMGLGATVALYSDLIFAAENAKIADPHISLGLVPGDGGTVIWPLHIGLPRAKQYLLTGDAITGAEAARIGLINEAVPAEELDTKVEAFAQKLARGSPRAVQFTKMALNQSLKSDVSAFIDAAFAYEVASAFTKDHVEAVKAFHEKRPPKFSGD
jgi:enoyl-CoA hydratase